MHALEVVEADPDTSWSMWDSAQAELDSGLSKPAFNTLEDVPLPPLTEWPSITGPLVDSQDASEIADVVDEVIETRPMNWEERPREQRKQDALLIVEKHHKRVANTIRTMWGYRECSLYINKLIMNGGDGMGNSRVGFNQAAADAMMELSDIHDAEFGRFDQNATFGSL